ncbi:MAG: putative sulfate exporter family transporter [Gemmatimonadota bacterium]|nr:MAG: putative sulfate exporter family transporter [Gemmatimonadota bacterium]
MTNGDGISSLWRKEDWWAVWLGLGIIVCALLFFLAGSTLGPLAVSPPRDWTASSQVVTHFADQWVWYVVLYAVFAMIFTVSTKVMGYEPKQYLPGFTVIYVASVLILVVSQSEFFHTYSLEAPLVALILGLLVGNFARLPQWLDASLRTEYYIKTGIVLLGATLPLTLIVSAGPIAFLQATIVSICTWLAIFFAATRLFGLDKRFGAVLGAGGAVCGVSASIAVGGAVKAGKEHVAISISIVSIWALVMIFVLPLASNALGLHPGVAGAWIGTSEFADAAGYAAAQTIASNSGTEAPIQTFTLMKVIGRDIWIGIWAFVLSIVAVAMWERGGNSGGEALGIGVVWARFPKFVIGFFLASVIMSIVVATSSADYATEIQPQLITPIKTLRTWTFVFTFLCIGLTTRFRELAKFGMPPFWAFTLGVAINVPLGYLLSTIVFSEYWMAVP